MKIATIGNCQLEVVGNVLRNAKNIHNGQITNIYSQPFYKMDLQKDMVNLYHELESSDVIFMQYHSEKWGPFATKKLKEYFDVVMLPTLESRVSTPQLAYFTDPLPDNLVYIDYRILHLYLTGFNTTQAFEHYHDIALDILKQKNFIQRDAENYNSLFLRGDLHYDYSDFYQHELLEDIECYTTISHPNNKNLGFLLTAVIHKLSGKKLNFNLDGADLLNNYSAPKLGSNKTDYFMMRDTGLALAVKINYAFFNSKKRDVLKTALLSSTYYHSLEDSYQNL